MNETQKCILDIFKCFTQICERHHIPYFAIGGTAIGAVRHNGFIPWDDDLDVAVPIEYYWKFFEYAQNEIPDYYSIKNGKKDYLYVYNFGKLIDDRTTFIEEWEMPDIRLYKGIFIDIMPISGIPLEKKEQERFTNSLIRNIQLNKWKRVPPKCSAGKKERIFKTIIKAGLLFQNNDYYFEKVFELLESRPFFESEITGYTWGLYNNKKIIFETKWFKETVGIKFEDTIMQCPVGYDEMLTKQFGDYMTLPPEDKRISCHKPYIDVNQSYKNIKKQMIYRNSE